MSEQSEYNDIDKTETEEWLSALGNVIQHDGSQRTRFLLQKLLGLTAHHIPGVLPALTTSYINTISAKDEEKIPEDHGVARRLRALIRWNAMMMVVRATKNAPELGGHLATYASTATLYEVGFNHFFHAPSDVHGGDLALFQGHASPGIYARAYLEGRISEAQLNNFRQEVEKEGLSSYPHAWLMPDFWQFANVSMGLGAMQAIYQARFMKYLNQRELSDHPERKVWCFCGDGEMDEPESLGALTVAGREKLDNLIFVINCNLQRLDGPVRGNGKIIQELESLFRGAGWNVIKVIWGRFWDPLLADDDDGLLEKRMNEVLDGEYQSYKARDGAFVREQFFGAYPELKERVAHLSDEAIWRLNRGGLDAQKVYAAYASAVQHKGQPTVILAKTIKGFGMGEAGEAQNITHQQKKMTVDQLKQFRDRFELPISDAQVESFSFYKPDETSEEIQFLKNHRKDLGGYFPTRRQQASQALTMPELNLFDSVLKGSDKPISTTMAFVRVLNLLLKDKNIAQHIVPIVCDESRTFGMEGLFRQIGIYAPKGQLYKPVDSEQLLYYREDKKGQILQEGISEAGAFSSWIAAGISYSANNLPMIPFYIYYSMFGFQRIGDFAWAAGDMKARGFLLGATAGRTTLAGEGLQHQDGHSHVLASTIPNCVTYDPTYAYELAVIMHDGLHRMYTKNENVFYYLTVMNENYEQPAMPAGVTDGIIRGMYLLKNAGKNADLQLLGSGTILLQALQAAELLEKDFGLKANVWSVTSFNELYRDGWHIARWNMRHPLEAPKTAYITECLQTHTGPVIAATDYIRRYAEQVREFIPHPYTVLGTDGFGRSDTRARLRYFFEVDAAHIAFAAIKSLFDQKRVDKKAMEKALKIYAINGDKPNPATM